MHVSAGWCAPAAAGAGACAARPPFCSLAFPLLPAWGAGTAPALAAPFAPFGAPAGARALSALRFSFLAAFPAAGAPAALAPLTAGAKKGAPAILPGRPVMVFGLKPPACGSVAPGAGARALTTTLPKGTPFFCAGAGASAAPGRPTRFAAAVGAQAAGANPGASPGVPAAPMLAEAADGAGAGALTDVASVVVSDALAAWLPHPNHLPRALATPAAEASAAAAGAGTGTASSGAGAGAVGARCPAGPTRLALPAPACSQGLHSHACGHLAKHRGTHPVLG